MITRLVAAVGLVLLVPSAFGQEFQPYPSPRISEVQWQSYYYKVERTYGDSVQRMPERLVEVFRDPETNLSWVFTQLGHPAHPAWIARRTAGEGDSANIQQVGYFAGSEAPFAEFFNLYLGRAPSTAQEPRERKE